MNLQDIVVRLERADWLYVYSDDMSAVRRGEAKLKKIFEDCQGNRNASRLYELARAYRIGTCLQRSDLTPEKRQEHWEAGWCWFGAVWFVFGIKLSEEEAQELVNGVDSKKPGVATKPTQRMASSLVQERIALNREHKRALKTRLLVLQKRDYLRVK